MKGIDTREWKKFRIGDLFEVKKVCGKPITSYQEGDTAYVTGAEYNNGIIGYVSASDDAISEGSCIAVDPIKGISHWMPERFIGRGFSGASVNLLYNDNLTELSGLYICCIIKKFAQRNASYANLFNGDRLRNAEILLPAAPDGAPDWSYMEFHMSETFKESETRLRNLTQPWSHKTSINIAGWKAFRIGDIFQTTQYRDGLHVPTGAYMPANKLIPGDTPRISVTGMNNGIIGRYADADDANYRTYENCISFSFLGTVFYHPYKASFDMKVHCLKPQDHDLNLNEGLFLVSCLRGLAANNSYDDQISSTVLTEMTVRLPAAPDGEPDWKYMESYMESVLEQSAKTLKTLASAAAS